MSGGSMGYTCFKIEEYAECLEDKELVELAKDMAKIFHDAEWYHSSDICHGTYLKSIDEFKRKWFGADRDIRLKAYIDESVNSVKQQLYGLVGGGERCELCAKWKAGKGSDYGSCPHYSNSLTHGWENACEDYEPW